MQWPLECVCPPASSGQEGNTAGRASAAAASAAADLGACMATSGSSSSSSSRPLGHPPMRARPSASGQPPLPGSTPAGSRPSQRACPSRSRSRSRRLSQLWPPRPPVRPGQARGGSRAACRLATLPARPWALQRTAQLLLRRLPRAHLQGRGRGRPRGGPSAARRRCLSTSTRWWCRSAATSPRPSARPWHRWATSVGVPLQRVLEGVCTHTCVL